MPFLTTEANQLAAALTPASDYARRARGTLNIADPGAAGRLRHLQAVETAVQGAVEFAAAVDKLLHPDPPPLVAHIRSLPAFQDNLPRLGYPHHICEALALFSAHHLPRNPLLDELRQSPEPEPGRPMGGCPGPNQG